jgi:hypothetical protein
MARTPKRIFWGSTGINNVSDPTRIAFDYRKGIQDLAFGVNIDLDDTGRPSRRKGMERKVAGRWTGLFDCGGYGIGVLGSTLYVIEPDFSIRGIAMVTEGCRLRAVKAGGRVYYVTGHEIGLVCHRENQAWQGGAYVGPETQRTFSDPPIGHLVAFYNGRIYVAVDNIIWYSEPFGYGWFDMARNFIPMASRIRMIAPVADGLYVSDDEGTWFLHGATPKEFARRQVQTAPAIEGTDVRCDGHKIHALQVSGPVQIWASTDGIIVGANGGQTINITEGRLTYPPARYGCGAIIDGRYVTCLEP